MAKICLTIFVKWFVASFLGILWREGTLDKTKYSFEEYQFKFSNKTEEQNVNFEFFNHKGTQRYGRSAQNSPQKTDSLDSQILTD